MWFIYITRDGKIAVQHYDELGRVRLSRSIENAATEDPYNEAHGIKVQTRYQTGNPNSYQLTSNPYRAATAAAAQNEESMGWTRSMSVNTGKHSEVETFSGASLPAPWGGNTNSTGKVQTDIDADRTLVTDQAGNQRISKSNALGQLTDIWEVMSASDSSTVSVTFPGQSLAYGYQTSYSYDTLNNLTTVNQGVQTRSFTYSSLSHLKGATNPESGTINYVYDGDGRRVKKTSSLETTIFVDNAGGTLVAEYSGALSQTQQVSYLTTDHLGSPRVITNENGAVTTRQDFSAFGDETLTAQRTQGLGYKPDSIRQDYTGYQKDDESGGLEFAQARYYNTKHGRFTSFDRLTASASVKDPQTFNRYSYAMNSPYKFTDPLGLISEKTGAYGNRGLNNDGGSGGGMVSAYGNAFQEIAGTDFVLLQRVELAIQALSSGTSNINWGNTTAGQIVKITLALGQVLKHGAYTAQRIVLAIQNGGVSIDVGSGSSTGPSRSQIEGLNKKLEVGSVSRHDAMSFITITLASYDVERPVNLEALIVHEGGHADKQAELIAKNSSRSQKQVSGGYFIDKSRYDDEKDVSRDAVKYLQKRGGDYVKFGKDMNDLKANGSINEENIEARGKAAPTGTLIEYLKGEGVKFRE